jgi:hypothetical protein
MFGGATQHLIVLPPIFSSVEANWQHANPARMARRHRALRAIELGDGSVWRVPVDQT